MKITSKKATMQSILAVVLLAITFVAIIKLAEEDTASTELKNQILSEFPNKPIWTSVFVKTLDEITPSYSFPIPFTEKKFFGINEFPLPGFGFVITAIILLVLSGFIMRVYHIKPWLQILILLAIIPVSYLISTWLLIGLYDLSASQIGVAKADATLLRQDYSSQFDSVFMPVLLASIISAIVILKTLFKQSRKAYG